MVSFILFYQKDDKLTASLVWVKLLCANNCRCLQLQSREAEGHVFIRRAAGDDSYLSVGHPLIGLFCLPGAQTGTIILTTTGSNRWEEVEKQSFVKSPTQCTLLLTYKMHVLEKTHRWFRAALTLVCGVISGGKRLWPQLRNRVKEGDPVNSSFDPCGEQLTIFRLKSP